MYYEGPYVSGGYDEPWSARGDDDGIWTGGTLGWEDATLRYVGQHGDIWTVATHHMNDADPKQMTFSGPLEPSRSAFDDTILGANADVFDCSFPNALQESGLSYLEQSRTQDPVAGPLPSWEKTPSLTMSPQSSLLSEFESFDYDWEFQMSQGPALNTSQHQNPDQLSDAKNDEIGDVGQAKTTNDFEKKPRDLDPSYPYACATCGKGFRRPGDRTKHERSVHVPYKDRPYACGYCTSRFVYPKDVIRHQKKKHKYSMTGPAKTIPDKSVSSGQIGDIAGASTKFLDDENFSKPSQNQNEFQFPHAESLEDSIIDEYYDHFLFSDTQQDQQHTTSRTHFPGEGSAPHRGARV